jgi:hypothetical protein
MDSVSAAVPRPENVVKGKDEAEGATDQADGSSQDRTARPTNRIAASRGDYG